MTLIEKLSNLGGIVDRDEMAKACSEIPVRSSSGSDDTRTNL